MRLSDGAAAAPSAGEGAAAMGPPDLSHGFGSSGAWSSSSGGHSGGQPVALPPMATGVRSSRLTNSVAPSSFLVSRDSRSIGVTVLHSRARGRAASAAKASPAEPASRITE